jgi:hypothetical protein
MLTLGLLERHFGSGFAGHMQDGMAALERMPLHISVEQPAAVV